MFFTVLAVRYIPQRPYHCKSNKENYCRATTKQGSSLRTPRRVAKLYRVLSFDAGKEISVEAAEVGDVTSSWIYFRRYPGGLCPALTDSLSYCRTVSRSRTCALLDVSERSDDQHVIDRVSLSTALVSCQYSSLF
jgi:hypothetical protein